MKDETFVATLELLGKRGSKETPMSAPPAATYERSEQYHPDMIRFERAIDGSNLNNPSNGLFATGIVI